MCDFSLGYPKWVEDPDPDPDPFAAEVATIVKKEEISFLQGTFGFLLIVATNYFVWLRNTKQQRKLEKSDLCVVSVVSSLVSSIV
jgi:hypothetical protein